MSPLKKEPAPQSYYSHSPEIRTPNTRKKFGKNLTISVNAPILSKSQNIINLEDRQEERNLGYPIRT